MTLDAPVLFISIYAKIHLTQYFCKTLYKGGNTDSLGLYTTPQYNFHVHIEAHSGVVSDFSSYMGSKKLMKTHSI